MRKVAEFLVAASLAACAAAPSAPAKGKGSGSGSGSGSSSCTSNCAGSFTLDDTGFIVQGDRWWSAESGPQLTGTIESSGGTLQAFTGDVALATATIANGKWSLQLPASTIPTTGVTMKLKLTAAGANPVEHDQLMSLDDGMPVVTSNSPFHDERGDTISFATGEAVHTHAGATVDLGGSSCSYVYKYTYLTDVTPKYATETSPNPIAWHLSLASPVGIDDTATAYRVRESATKTVLDWTPVSPDADGSYTVELHRDGQHPIADLGTRDGFIYLDVQAKDGFGMTNVQSYCIMYQRLAPPLEIGPIGGEALFGMTLAADSSISNVLNANGGPPALSQVFVQHAAEPVTIAIALDTPSGTYNLDVADWYVKLGTRTVTCGTPTEPDTTSTGCSPLVKAGTNTDATVSGAALTKAAWSIAVVDDTTHVAFSGCTANGQFATCSIPARAAGSLPHPYRVIAYVDDMENLWTSGTGPFGEYTELQRTYSGNAPIEFTHCDSRYTSGTNSYCSSTSWAHIHAIRSASVAFAGFGLAYQAQLAGWPAPIDVPYAYPGKSAAMTWDLGTDKLPGEP